MNLYFFPNLAPSFSAAIMPCCGSIASGIGTMKTNEAMNKAIEDQIAQQQLLAQRASPFLIESMGESGADTADASIDTGTRRAEGRYKQIDSGSATTASNRGIHDSPTDRQSGAWGDLMGSLRAPMQGYSEFELQQMLKNLRAAQQLGAIGMEAKNTAQTLGPSMQTAQHANDWLQVLGSGMNSMGSVAGGMI
jgi:hypothetical protein